jgi:hypothetical protein
MELTMRQSVTIVTIVVLWAGMVCVALAGAAEKSKSPDPQAGTAANAELRAEFHRTMIALTEERSAAKPEQAKIEELTKKLRDLRTELRGQRPAAGGQNAPMCPFGGPGMGMGRGCGGGGGKGPGGGFGPGAGRGWGGGGGQGFGPGAGRGWGGGAGNGQGLGPGAGQGRGPGGAAFQDIDNDGVCDYYQLRQKE